MARSIAYRVTYNLIALQSVGSHARLDGWGGITLIKEEIRNDAVRWRKRSNERGGLFYGYLNAFKPFR